jgi:acyl-CoA reductase-like NAD-dependent aldehyde dehydrogenase
MTLHNETAERLDGHSWIDGRDRRTGSSNFESVVPGTGKILGYIDDADEGTVREAVKAAKLAFTAWSDAPAGERRACLFAFAEAIGENASKLALLETLEVGRPLGEAEGLISRVAPGLVRDYAMLIDRVRGDLTAADAQCLGVSWRRPRGVVAAITPWNFPVMNVLVRVAPALAAGNAIIVKPSEFSPRSAVLLAQLAEEAGIPRGVFNVLVGTGNGAGARLVSQPDIDLITFTGSTRTGMNISATAASASLKPVLLECGGKSPQILLDDIFDDQSIWPSIFFSAFWNTGQWCVAKTRLLVPESRLEQTLSGLVAAAAGWKVGDPMNPETRLGPLATSAQFRKYEHYKSIADDEGDLTELPCPEGSLHPGGYFVRPCVVSGLSASSRVVNDEIFGPLLTIQTYRDLDEAVSLSNGTAFGLSASVWTRQADTAHHLARSVQAGNIQIHSSGRTGAGPGFGGYFEPQKQSGLGVDGGLPGLLAYTTVQSVTFNH